MIAARGVDVCTEYGVALAAEDFVPCVLATAAFIVLCMTVRSRVPKAFPVAVLGAFLIALGGFAKATWKMLVATGCWEYPILENLLFPCIGVGFSAMAWALLCLKMGRTVAIWPFAGFAGAAGVASLLTGDTWPMLIAAAVGATFFGIVAASIAFAAGKKSVGVIFVVYVLGTNILPALAAQPKQSAEIQWAEQLTNSAIQLCFLLGALWIREYMSTQSSAETEDDDKAGVPA